MNQITLTVPLDYNALTRASDMLHGLAIDVSKQGGNADTAISLEEFEQELLKSVSAAFEIPVEQLIEAVRPAVSAESHEHQEATTATVTTAVEEVPPAPAAEPSPSLFAENPVDPKPPEPPVTGADSSTTVAAPASSAPSGVDVDKDGLPWDARIHAGSKAKLAKTEQWKKKRGVDAALVAEVEAELRAAMAVPAPAEPVPNAPAAEPAPTVDSEAATAPTATPPPPAPAAAAPSPAPTPATPPPPAAAPTTAQPASGITTLPALMAASTAAGKTPEEMLAAANKAGLASVALLGARPDLVPTVAAELGLGG
jgi:hypothetical protein